MLTILQDAGPPVGGSERVFDAVFVGMLRIGAESCWQVDSLTQEARQQTDSLSRVARKYDLPDLSDRPCGRPCVYRVQAFHHMTKG